MTVYKNLLITLLSGISAASIASLPSALFLDNTLSISGSIGYSEFERPTNQTLIISNYVTDLLTNSKQHHNATYNFSVKQQLNINSNTINKIMLGPTLYFQKAHNSGQVWEMFSPEFYNYQYDMKSKNVNFLLESDVYFKPVTPHITPFLTAGIGFGVGTMSYNDYALPGIPFDSERHWSMSQTKAIYELGAGLAIPLNSHLALNLRYAYFYRGKANKYLVQFQSINMNLNNQNVLLGIHYFL